MMMQRSPQAEWFAFQSIERVNRARAEAGLSKLAEDAALAAVAEAHSAAMATQGFYGHVDPQGRDVGDRLAQAGYVAATCAENVARGQDSPAAVVEGWLNSPGHRANIMNGDLHAIGAGYSYTPDPPHHYWTHVFATPDASLDRDASQYPAEALAGINRARRGAGLAALSPDPALTGIAEQHVGQLVGGSSGFRRRSQEALNRASQAALGAMQRATAQAAAGAAGATPEDVVAQWTEQGARSPLLDGSLRAAGLAYHYAAQDELRHYWLAVLGG